MTSRTNNPTDSLRREINSLLSDLFGFGAISSFNLSYPDYETGMISWARISDEPMIDDFSHLSIENYLNWARRGDYSALLLDGSLLQMTYHLSGSTIVGHRLSYVPTPLAGALRNDSEQPLDTGEWLGGDFASAILDHLIDAPWEAGLRSMIRFDYDPKSARAGHPASHLTINSVECRIPCISPVSPGQFIDFVFSNFYPNERKKMSRFFGTMKSTERKVNLLDDDERAYMHLAW